MSPEELLQPSITGSKCLLVPLLSIILFFHQMIISTVVQLQSLDLPHLPGNTKVLGSEFVNPCHQSIFQSRVFYLSSAP
jgi:hypothetical protein